jgi:hypothetical protein
MLLKLAHDWRRDDKLRQQATDGGDATAPAQARLSRTHALADRESAPERDVPSQQGRFLRPATPLCSGNLIPPRRLANYHSSEEAPMTTEVQCVGCNTGKSELRRFR